VSVKGFSEAFYREQCRGSLETTLSTLKVIRQQGVWLEVVALIIPTLSDDMGQIRWFCQWVKTNLGPDVPVHFTRFWPSYKLKNLPQTPIATLEQARKIALSEGLSYAYVGNLPGHAGSNTYCPGCGRALIRRVGFQVIRNDLQAGRCPSCGRAIPGVWA
jgi:pyruvate formate lyase activating enzyme